MDVHIEPWDTAHKELIRQYAYFPAPPAPQATNWEGVQFRADTETVTEKKDRLSDEFTYFKECPLTTVKKSINLAYFRSKKITIESMYLASLEPEVTGD